MTALAIGNFVVAVNAFIVVGLLPEIGRHFGLTLSQASLLFTIYAGTYAVMSPILVALTGWMTRRLVLAIAMGMIAASTTMIAVSPNVELVYLARAMAGLAGCLFTPVAATVAYSVSPPARRATALVTVFFGISFGQAFGVPLGTLLGHFGGWQTVFYTVGAMAALNFLFILLTVSPNISSQPASLAILAKATIDWRLMLLISVTLIHCVSICCLFTFISPIGSEIAGLDGDQISIVLMAYGIGSLIGGYLVGRLSEKRPPALLVLTCVALAAVASPVYSLMPLPPVLIYLLTFCWGFLTSGVTVPQQKRVLESAPFGQSVGLAYNATANYGGLTLGSALGALVVQEIGLGALGATAAGVGICTAFLVLVTIVVERPRR